MKEYNIKFSIGDHSGDGHYKKTIINIKSNVPKAKIEKAYMDGAKKIKLDLVNDVAVEYEDSSISEESIKKLEKVGFDVAKLYDKYYKGYHLNVDSYFEIYKFIVNMGDKKIQLNEIEEETIYLGGYGLFYG